MARIRLGNYPSQTQEFNKLRGIKDSIRQTAKWPECPALADMEQFAICRGLQGLLRLNHSESLLAILLKNRNYLFLKLKNPAGQDWVTLAIILLGALEAMV